MLLRKREWRNKGFEKKEENAMKLYSPWVIFAKKVEKFFEKDPEVKFEFDEEKNVIKLFVDNKAKAEALGRLLPLRKTFGNVDVHIMIIPANKNMERVEYLEAALKGNEAFSHITTIEDIPPMHLPNPITYCVFKKEVVQYGADDLSSESGMASTLYQDLAKEIFSSIDGVYFCTDTE